jgi:hypothetical protein
MIRKRPSTRDVFVLSGIDQQSGESFGPYSNIPRYDEVTGSPLPARYVGMQRGLVKDIRLHKGSWDRINPYPVIYSTYDPALGIATKPAGQYDDEFSV